MSFSKQEYEDYIASPAWDTKRRRALRKQEHRCRACGATDDLHVHHHTYERFRREHDDDLIVLCRVCHKTVHRIHNEQRFRKGPNLTLTEVTYAFLAKTKADAYSAAVLADHTPSVPAKPPRTDQKREVDLSRSARGARPGAQKSLTKKAVRERAQRARQLRAK